MRTWLLVPAELEEIKRIETRVIESSSTFSGLKITSEASPMTIAFGTATVRVDGYLVKDRDPVLDFFGIKHTAYSEIASQVREAESKGAKRGVLVINSPGGELTGLVDAMDAVSDSNIEWKAIGEDIVASGAYMIASQASGGIFAKGEMSLFGSIGVATSISISSWRKDITNTDSPKKRPDATTPEGLDAVREELDDIYGVLSRKIASGRGVSVETVKKDYGQGAVMAAQTAIDKKIIDGMEASKKKKTAANAQADGGKMDIDTLKKEHPAVYQAAVNDGIAVERKRTEAHCKLAKRYGTASIAIDDIMAEGKEADVEVLASHQDESGKRKQSEDRSSENVPDLGAGTAATTTAGKTATTKEEIEAEFRSEFGAAGWNLEIGA